MRNLCALLAVLLLAGCGDKDAGQASAAPAVAVTDNDSGKNIPSPEKGETSEPVDSVLADTAKSIAAELGEFRQILPPNPLNCLALLQLETKAAKLKYSAADSEAAKQYLDASPGSEQAAFGCDGLDPESPGEILAWLEALPKAISYYQYVAAGAEQGFFRSVPEDTTAAPEVNRELVYKFYLRAEIIQKDQSFSSTYFYFRLCEKFSKLAADIRDSGVDSAKVKSALREIEQVLVKNPDSAAIRDSLAQLNASLWELTQSL